MKKTKKHELLEKIVVDMNSAKSPEELLNYLVDKCIEITGALTGSIMLINPRTRVLDIRVSRGLKKEYVENVKLKVGEGVTGHVALKGTPLIVNDADKTDYYVRIRDDLKSELAVPLKIKDEITGVINVDSNRINAFNEHDLDLLNTISHAAAQILYKANLLEELQSKIRNQEILLKIASIIEETREIEQTFSAIIKLISDNIAIKRGMLILINEDNRLKVFSGYRLSREAIERGVYNIGEGVIGKVVRFGKPIAIENISESRDFLNKMKIRRGNTEKNSFFAVPLKYDNITSGVLGIEMEYTNEKDFREMKELFMLTASLLSHKIHNYEIIKNEKEKLIRKNLELKEKLIDKDREIIFVGKNEKIQELLGLVDTVSDTDATVLITGETGTGKEVLAKMIHFKSKRWDRPFISINCASIPENLLESELFGYKKGAFTGAVSDKKGKFLAANDGTLFLDEIGDMSFNLQSKLLRALQEKQIEPLGEEKSVKINVRIIAATNKNLEKMVRDGGFREDLFYRLNVISVKIPALSERRDDIPLFIDFFISHFNKKYNKKISGIADNCMNMLLAYPWPGNIRELENAIERAVILSKKTVLDPALFPDNIRGSSAASADEDIFYETIKLAYKNSKHGDIHKSIMERVEKQLIETALTESDSRQTRASEILGLHRNTLHQKIRDYNL